MRVELRGPRFFVQAALRCLLCHDQHDVAAEKKVPAWGPGQNRCMGGGDGMSGYMGKLLIVDLTCGELRDEPLDRSWARDFVGGAGYAARYLYDEFGAGYGSFGPTEYPNVHDRPSGWHTGSVMWPA